MDDGGQAKSIFLAALMIGSVILGALVFDLDGSKENLAPIIDGSIPNQILIGSTDSIELSISDEDLPSLALTVTMDGQSLEVEPDENGTLIFDISELSVGEHALKIIALDSVGQESRWTSLFTIHYPAEDATVMIVNENEIIVEKGDSASIQGTVVHPAINTCELIWSDGDIGNFSLSLPIDDSGRFTLSFDEVNSNMTIITQATCGTWEDTVATQTIWINATEPTEPA